MAPHTPHPCKGVARSYLGFASAHDDNQQGEQPIAQE
jgi:hypothetical protein